MPNFDVRRGTGRTTFAFARPPPSGWNHAYSDEFEA